MLIFTGFFSFVGNFFTLHPIDAVVHVSGTTQLGSPGLDLPLHLCLIIS